MPTHIEVYHATSSEAQQARANATQGYRLGLPSTDHTSPASAMRNKKCHFSGPLPMTLKTYTVVFISISVTRPPYHLPQVTSLTAGRPIAGCRYAWQSSSSNNHIAYHTEAACIAAVSCAEPMRAVKTQKSTNIFPPWSYLENLEAIVAAVPEL